MIRKCGNKWPKMCIRDREYEVNTVKDLDYSVYKMRNGDVVTAEAILNRFAFYRHYNQDVYKRQGVEDTISADKEAFKASVPSPMVTPLPKKEAAKPDKPPSLLLPISGERVTSTVYCLGILIATITPVSYTHLDVYKRQVQGYQQKFLFLVYNGLYGIIDDFHFSHNRPVPP